MSDPTVLFCAGVIFAASMAGCGGAPVHSDITSGSLKSNGLVIIEGRARGQDRIGPYRPIYSRQDYARAVRVFGKPSSWGLDSNLCIVRWRRLGLDLDFRATGDCDAPKLEGSKLVVWCGASAHTSRWRTEKGLRVGDGTARLRRLYPRAKLYDYPPRPPFWRLIPDQGLYADVWGGEVVGIRLVGYCT